LNQFLEQTLLELIHRQFGQATIAEVETGKAVLFGFVDAL
jgi:hypothetical protein